MTMLKIDHLTIRSEQAILVDDLSLRLQAYSAITLLGETGSGKSLLAQAIVGYLPASLMCTGEVTLFGQTQNSRTKAEREALWGHRIGVLPQEPWYALDPIMPVGQQVEDVHALVRQRPRPEAQQRTGQAFHTLGLDHAQEKWVQQLSGGMAQRVAYLCATQGGTELLIADEPTKGLDRARCEQIIQQLLAHQQKGALLTITHDIEVAQRLGGEVIVMRRGVIQERGPADQVIGSPQSAYAKALIAANPRYWPAYRLKQVSKPLLTVKDLHKQRGSLHLLGGLSFTLHEGEVLGVYGESGCGKSTLGNLLLGLEQPSNGQVEYLGDESSLRGLKLYQDPPSAHAKSVTLQVLLDDLCAVHVVDTQRIASLMQRLNLSPSLLSRTASQVSGGELQRFAILRALLLKPMLLVADEPSSRLDPITAAHTLKLIVEMTQEINCALLLISHDQQALTKLCHRVMKLE